MTRLIPYEVYESIISNLDDRKDLKAASLVSKSWLELSRRLLFQFISLGETTYKKFLDLLDSSSSSLGMLVKKLKLYGEAMNDKAAASWMYDVIISCSTSCPEITHLIIWSTTITDWSIEDAKLMTAFPRLNTLDFPGICLGSELQVLALLHHHPLIQNLRVYASVEGTHSASSMVSKPFAEFCIPPSLKSINITHPMLTVLLNWFEHSQTYLYLRSVTVWSLKYQNVPSFGCLLGKLGHSLEELSISVLRWDPEWPDVPLNKTINLSHNPCLRSISFRNVSSPATQSAFRNTWIMQLLESVESSLERITIVPWLSHKDKFDWELLDDQCTRLSRYHLKELVMDLTAQSTSTQPEFEAHIREKMPMSRSLLRFETLSSVSRVD